MLPLVCCLLFLPPVLAEEGQVDTAAVSDSAASLLTVTEDMCRTREDAVRALGFHTPIYPLSCFPAALNETCLLYG